MPSEPSRNRPAAFVAIVAFTALTCALSVGRGQPPNGAVKRRADVPAPTRRFISAKDCSRCHKPADLGGAPHFAGDPDQPRLVRFDESKVWSEVDKHSRAFDALTGRRGEAMGMLLGYKNIRVEPACLSCHSTGFLPADSDEIRAEAVKSADQGVNCAACHGSYLEWVANHGLTADQTRRWRLKTADEKSRAFGMTDLRDPATRAGVCVSCHVGNASEGKVITHAMYAAGHPPLPGIEVATFLEAMPPHWAKPADVEAFQKDAGLRERNHVDFSEPQATKAVVVGAVVTLRDAMRLLASRAESATAPAGEVFAAWPDYAQFDCYACHHDLQAPGFRRQRQMRGFDHRFDGAVVSGVAGRPQFRPWTLALAGVALARADEANKEEFRKAVKALYAAFDARPFGDPAAVTRAARRLEAWSEGMLVSIGRKKLDAGSPPEVLKALASTPAEQLLDYDSSRQVAWASKAVYADWTPKPANHDRFEAVLADLDLMLKLDPHKSLKPRADAIAAQERAEGALRSELRANAVAARERADALRETLLKLSEDEFKVSIARAADYDPDVFKEALGRLKSLMAEVPAAKPGP